MIKQLALGISLISFTNLGIAKDTIKSQDPLKNSQKIITDALKANNVRMRVAAENMANSNSAEYIPKTVDMRIVKNKGPYSTIKVRKVRQQQDRMYRVYDPHHPKADADGMVLMPKIDPLMMTMDVNKARLDNERMMKTFQVVSDMRHRTIRMINH